MKKILATICIVFTMNNATAQQNYCAPQSLGCGFGDFIDNFEIPSVGFSDLNTGCSQNNHDIKITTIIPLEAGLSYNYQTTHQANNQKIKIWIDFNNDGVFEDGGNELVSTTQSLGNYSSSIANGVIQIPADISTGSYRMRIFGRSGLGYPTPCSAGFGHGEAHDYTVSITSNATCPYPSGLSVENLPNHAKKIMWNGDGQNFSVEYGVEGFTQGEGTIVNNIQTNDYTLISLPNLNQFYEFYVKNNCASEETSWIGPYKFYHGYCSSQPTSNDGSGISSVIINNEHFTQGDVTYFDHSATPVTVNKGEVVSFDITLNTGYTYYNNVWIDFNKNLEFESDELFALGESEGANPTTFSAQITLPNDLDSGTYKMRYIASDNANDSSCYSGSYAVTLEFSLYVQEEGTAGGHEVKGFATNIYPNPVKDLVNIESDELINRIDLFDINGRLLRTMVTNSKEMTIDVSGFSSGTYMIVLYTSGKISKNKFVIQNR